MGVPVAPATVDRHHRHRWQRNTVHVERHRLGRRHAGQCVRVIPSEPVEHHDQGQWIPPWVPRRIGDRVAHPRVAGLGEEGTGLRHTGGRVDEGRRAHRARTVQRIEGLLPRANPVRDQLGTGGGRHDHRAHGGGSPPDQPPPTEPARPGTTMFRHPVSLPRTVPQADLLRSVGPVARRPSGTPPPGTTRSDAPGDRVGGTAPVLRAGGD